MARNELPSACAACDASSAARAASRCFMLTPRITFQPLAVASVPSAVRSAGVIVAVDQDGGVSPVEVQNVWSTRLPPMRTVDEPRVLRYWARLPLVKPGTARSDASKDNPSEPVENAGPATVWSMMITGVAAVAVIAVDAANSSALTPIVADQRIPFRLMAILSDRIRIPE